jgi:hypothetical protein
MAFRDDHEAALARADALERELARAKQQLAQRDAIGPPVDRVVTDTALSTARRRPAPVIAVTLALTVVLVCWIAMRTDPSPVVTSTPASLPARMPCTLATDPPGATVFRRCRNAMADSLDRGFARRDTPETPMPRVPAWTEIPLGTTPLTLDASTWNSVPIGCEGLFVKLGGGSDIAISSPAASDSCDTRTITLTRERD